LQKRDDSIWLTYLKYTGVILVALSGLAFSAGCIFEIAESYSMMNNRFQRKRATEALEFVESHADSIGSWVSILGASEVHVAVKPDLIVAELANERQGLQLLNFGFTNLSLMQMRAFFLRLKKVSDKKGLKIPISILNISVDILTEKGASDVRLIHADDVFLSFVDLSTLWQFSELSWSRKASLSFQKIFGRGLVPEVSSFYLWSSFQRNSIGRHLDLRFHNPFFVLWYWPEFWPDPQWDPACAGAFNWNLPASQKNYDLTVQRAHEAAFAEAERAYRNETVDLRDQTLSTDSLVQLEANIDILKDISTKLILVQLPVNPRVSVTAETEKRVRAELQKIANRKGLPIHFLSDEVSFVEEDFFDSTHLTGTGVVKLNSALAKEIRQIRDH